MQRIDGKIANYVTEHESHGSILVEYHLTAEEAVEHARAEWHHLSRGDRRTSTIKAFSIVWTDAEAAEAEGIEGWEPEEDYEPMDVLWDSAEPSHEWTCTCGCRSEAIYDYGALIGLRVFRNGFRQDVTIDDDGYSLDLLENGSCPVCDGWEDGNGNDVRPEDFGEEVE